MYNDNAAYQIDQALCICGCKVLWHNIVEHPDGSVDIGKCENSYETSIFPTCGCTEFHFAYTDGAI
jgi:hypothetical protein